MRLREADVFFFLYQMRRSISFSLISHTVEVSLRLGV